MFAHSDYFVSIQKITKSSKTCFNKSYYFYFLQYVPNFKAKKSLKVVRQQFAKK